MQMHANQSGLLPSPQGSAVIMYPRIGPRGHVGRGMLVAAYNDKGSRKKILVEAFLHSCIETAPNQKPAVLKVYGHLRS